MVHSEAGPREAAVRELLVFLLCRPVLLLLLGVQVVYYVLLVHLYLAVEDVFVLLFLLNHAVLQKVYGVDIVVIVVVVASVVQFLLI